MILADTEFSSNLISEKDQPGILSQKQSMHNKKKAKQ